MAIPALAKAPATKEEAYSLADLYSIALGGPNLTYRPSLDGNGILPYLVQGTYIVAQSRVPAVQKIYSGLSPERKAVKDYVLSRVAQEGFDPQTIDRIIMCESGYNPQARHLNTDGTWDIGLWQINDVHKLSVEDRMDVQKSTEYAITLLKSPTGLHHWMCYR